VTTESPSSTLTPAKTSVAFEKYRLIAELGQGGMADVFLAVQQGPVGFNKLVVIKRLRESFAEDPEFIAMLLDEARLAARLNHPNVVQTNEVGQHGRHHYIAMEYLDGQPLHRISHRAGKKAGISLKLFLRIFADVLAGLHHAHELTEFDGTTLGVVHRDVTPHNIFVTYSGNVKVVDFGIAKAVGRSAETRTGVVKGKVTYMSPEQAAGQEIDRRADIFSVGVMLWEALTQQRMWKTMPDVVIVGQLMQGNVTVSPKSANPKVPDELDAICRKALAPDRENRYGTAAEFQADLEQYMRTSGEATSATELGAFVSELFDDRRRELKLVIERQLAELKNRSSTTIVASLEGVSSSSPSLRSPTFTVELPPRSDSGPSSTSDVRSDTAASISQDVIIRPKRRGGARSPLRLGLGVILLLGAIVGVYFAVVRQAPPSGASESATISIHLRAKPASARFIVDDGEPLENPFIGKLPRDDKTHHLRIEAEGRTAIEQELTFDKDVSIDVSLEPLLAATATATSQTDAETPSSTTSSNPDHSSSATASSSADSKRDAKTKAGRSGGGSGGRHSHTSDVEPPPPPPPPPRGRQPKPLDTQSPW